MTDGLAKSVSAKKSVSETDAEAEQTTMCWPVPLYPDLSRVRHGLPENELGQRKLPL